MKKLLTILLLCVTLSTHAQSTRNLQTQITALQAQVKTLQSQIAALQSHPNTTVAALQTQVAAMLQQFAALQQVHTLTFDPASFKLAGDSLNQTLYLAK